VIAVKQLRIDIHAGSASEVEISPLNMRRMIRVVTVDVPREPAVIGLPKKKQR
jgi:hypothetical protein